MVTINDNALNGQTQRPKDTIPANLDSYERSLKLSNEQFQELSRLKSRWNGQKWYNKTMNDEPSFFWTFFRWISGASRRDSDAEEKYKTDYLNYRQTLVDNLSKYENEKEALKKIGMNNPFFITQNGLISNPRSFNGLTPADFSKQKDDGLTSILAIIKLLFLLL